MFRRLQNRLFDLGSELATPDNAVYEGMFRIGDAEVNELEPLRSFVEREILALSRVESIGEGVFPYVNRLSDLFFVLSRWVGKHLSETEYFWKRALQSHACKKRK